jgi:hypothetical protein
MSRQNQKLTTIKTIQSLEEAKKKIQTLNQMVNGKKEKTSRNLMVQSILEECFDRGKSLHEASKETGIGSTTILSYYKKFADSYLEFCDTDFITDLVVAREQALYQIDNVLEELEELKSHIKKMMDLEPSRTDWVKLMIDIIKKCAKFEMVKFQLNANPMFSPWYYKDNNHDKPGIKIWPTRITI